MAENRKCHQTDTELEGRGEFWRTGERTVDEGRVCGEFRRSQKKCGGVGGVESSGGVRRNVWSRCLEVSPVLARPLDFQ